MKLNTTYSRQSLSSQNGTVLILVAIICVALIAILGLALDSSILSAGKNKQERVAEYSALAALETYQATSAGATPREIYLNKVAAAEARAEEVIGFTLNTLLNERLSQHRLSPVDLAVHTTPSSAQDGRIDFGVWYFADPPTTSDCGDGTAFSPCFIENNHGDSNTVAANAVRITIQARDEALYTTVFAKIMGMQEIGLSSNATAAFQPRRVVYAIDLSGSTDDESHDPALTRSTFAINNPNPIGLTCDASGSPANDTVPSPYTMVNALDLARWEGAGTTRTNYECFEIQYEDPDTGNHTEYYLIDTATRPEPLYTILDAINIGMQTFQARAVKGDEVGFIGYDHDILKTRRTPDEASATTEMIKPEDPEYADWLDLTDTNSANDALRRSRMLIIRRDGGLGLPAAYTNLPAAILEAQSALAGGVGYLGADNFIVNFSDGLSNCSLPELCPPSFGGDDVAALNASKNEVLTISTTQLRPNNITFNMVILGQGIVGAHRVLYKSIDTPNKCMSEGEIRRRDYKLADEEDLLPDYCRSTSATDGGCFLPNAYSQVVKETGGLWNPVLNPCPKPPAMGGGTCSGPAEAMAVQDHLNQQCQGLAPADPAPRLGNLSGYTDTAIPMNKGRLTCDPLCRTRSQQIQDVLNDILRGNPYVLVQSMS